ncbi:urease subunit beta [Clostridium sp. DJ247]|uniref:urease subunit beta n=1 Tax=Clostridium sp. DJ247 TaxID=2726188 RepID=UPI001F4C8E1B|nr:urease subunit beta [Clostridium sp. DJ247]MBC2581211.1 urease subunit beta [Clostridium sp. DJ247]
MIPGEIIVKDRDIVCNVGRKTANIIVANTGDRPVQVGSHFHFFEVNKCLKFDREKSYGMRLDIVSGTAVRFEPGEEKDVVLVELGGKNTVHGLNNLTAGPATEDNKKTSILKAAEHKFKGVSKDEL